MKEIVMVGASKWCKPCVYTKERVSSVAYQMGVNMTYHDLGERENIHEEIGKLKDRGFLFEGPPGIPMFFVDRKQIKRPTSLDLMAIRDWITANYAD